MKRSIREERFGLGTVYSIPLCDPNAPDPAAKSGTGVIVARPTPFPRGNTQVLMYGFGKSLDELQTDPDWITRPPSTASIVVTKYMPEASWTRVGGVSVERVVAPQAKTLCVLDNTQWRHVEYDPVRCSVGGQLDRITDTEAEGRILNHWIGHNVFQYFLFVASRLGWTWAPPKHVVQNGYHVIKHLL